MVINRVRCSNSEKDRTVISCGLKSKATSPLPRNSTNEAQKGGEFYGTVHYPSFFCCGSHTDDMATAE